MPLTVIDSAVHNSPPPMDDVAGANPLDFDEKDPDRPLTRREQLIDEAVRRTSEVLCVDPDNLRRRFGDRVLQAQVAAQFRMLVGQIEADWLA